MGESRVLLQESVLDVNQATCLLIVRVRERGEGGRELGEGREEWGRGR